MEILNPGHIIPVYTNTASQMHNRCGCKEFDWAIPIAQDEQPNIQFPITPGISTTWVVQAIGESNTATITSSYYDIKTTSDGLLSWFIMADWFEALPSGCDTYYFKFTNADIRGAYYSERFRQVNFNQSEKIYKLTFSNSVDIDGILYQTGYSQKLWLEHAVFDTPEMEDITETEPDGDSVERVVFQSVQRREVLRFPYVPDFWQGVLQRLRSHDTITIEKIATSQTFMLSGQDVQFESEVQDVCFSIGQISWLSSVQVGSSCENNYTLA